MNDNWLEKAAEIRVNDCRAAREAVIRREEGWERIWYVMTRLHAGGVKPLRYYSGSFPTIVVRQHDLRMIRKLFGKLTVRTRMPQNEETIKVSLRAENGLGVDFDYETKMPRKSRCRIERSVVSCDQYALVCPKN